MTKGKMIACPLGYAPINLRNNKISFSVFFDRNICSACTNSINFPSKKGLVAIVSALTKNNSELQSAERLKALPNSRISIAIAQESRPPYPSSTEKPESNTLDLGGSRKSPFAQPLKRLESTSSGPMRSSTGKTKTNQNQIGPFRSFCTPLRSLKTPSTSFNTVFLTDSKKIGAVLRTGILQNLNATGFQRI